MERNNELKASRAVAEPIPDLRSQVQQLEPVANRVHYLESVADGLQVKSNSVPRLKESSRLLILKPLDYLSCSMRLGGFKVEWMVQKCFSRSWMRQMNSMLLFCLRAQLSLVGTCINRIERGETCVYWI